jgi:alkylhydroperoxidase family enzyme
VLARWGQLLAEIKRPLDKRRFELVTFVAAHELGNSACALAHGNALREFLGDEQIIAIAEGHTQGVLGPAEQALLGFARQVAADASQVAARDVARLQELGWTDVDIFDAAATAAGRAFFTKLLDALGVMADASFMSLAEPLRQALTVGRPIDDEACVGMPEEQPSERT